MRASFIMDIVVKRTSIEKIKVQMGSMILQVGSNQIIIEATNTPQL